MSLHKHSHSLKYSHSNPSMKIQVITHKNTSLVQIIVRSFFGPDLYLQQQTSETVPRQRRTSKVRGEHVWKNQSVGSTPVDLTQWVKVWNKVDIQSKYSTTPRHFHPYAPLPKIPVVTLQDKHVHAPKTTMKSSH